MSKVAADFEKIIHADRARKKNEALAARIFNKDRRSSAPGVLTKGAGVQKRVSLSSARPTGNINHEWTHDLHERGTGTGTVPRGPGAAAAAGPGSLGTRVSRPSQAPTAAVGTARGKQRRAAQVARALIREEQTGARQSQTRQAAARTTQTTMQTTTAVQAASGLSIRGIASVSTEPLVVMAQNFAPGTTAADIESAMTPVGGLVNSCRILKTTPLVIAEIVFETRDGALRVIDTFNNQTADGRLLHVYPKAGQPAAALGQGNGAAAPRALALASHNTRNGVVVDGSLGFDDPMDTDGLANAKLYSDDLVGSKPPTGPAAGVRRGRRNGRGRR